MIDSTVYVSSHFGRTVRVLLETCDGEPLQSSDVQKMRYSIFRKKISGQTPVNGHQNITIPAAALADETKTADNGQRYNLEFVIDGTTHKPFPQAGGAIYTIVLGVTLETDGKEYGTEQEVVTL